jgi:hypothetical protein
LKTTRILILALILGFTPIAPALADNDVGCGVGTAIWEGNSGLEFKLLASFTNGLTFQSISITFGLLNCNGHNTVTASARARHFAATHLDRIARDAAVGGGESLDTLALLLEVREQDREAFSTLAQSHFGELFPSDRVTSDEMLETLTRLLQQSDPMPLVRRS